MSKLLLVGLDGANPDLVSKWINELPTFKMLRDRGVFGKLRSTIPAATIPAWNSIFSGKNPGKLGLYDFIVIPSYVDHALEPGSYLYSDTLYLWDILTSHNKKSVIVNVPITYPPARLNGLMISGGLLTPFYKDVEFTYPANLKDEIDKIAGGYEILPFTDLSLRGKEREYFAKLILNVDKQVAVVKYLMKQYEWDFFSYVFFVTDSVQHYFWHHYDKKHPWHDSSEAIAWGDAIKLLYVKVDQKLGEILSLAPSDTDVLVISDHGSGPMLGHFLVNKWLQHQGLLRLKRRSQWKEFVFAKPVFSMKNFLLRNFPTASEALVERLPKTILQRFLVKGQKVATYSRLLSEIDWANTRAYGLGSDGSIYINLKGREPFGTVLPREYERVRQQVMGLLATLTDQNGVGLPVQVYRKEDVYCGQYLASAPDIVFIIDDYKYVQRSDIDYNQVWKIPDTSGGHNPLGIFAAYGPNIANGVTPSNEFRVYDIMPTILHVLGIPIPDDLDGRILTEIFRKGSRLSERTPEYMKYEPKPSQSGMPFTRREEEQIRQRLEDLGYV